MNQESKGLVQKHYSRRAFLRGAVVLGGGYAALLASCQMPQGAPVTDGATPAAPSGGEEGAAPAGEAVTLRVWGYGLDDTRAQARVAVYQQSNPSITLEPVGGELNTQQLLTAVASGDPPEVVNVDRSQTGSWAGRGAIDPLDDLISRDAFDLEQFYPVLISQVTHDGQVYGVPQFVNVDLFFMNLDVLAEAGVDPESVNPGDWSQLADLGEQLHQMEGDQLTRTGFDTKMQDGRLWLWSWANGAEPISADGLQANFADPLVIEALAWGVDTVNRQGGELARAAFSQTQNFFSAQNPVLIGQTAMTLFEQWLIGVMKVNPDANFRTLLPRLRNSEAGLTDATGAAFAIPRGVAARDAAWSFIQGMTSTEAWLAGEEATKAANEAEGVPYHPTISGNVAADQEAWNTLYMGISPSYDQTVALFPEALEVARYRYSGPVAAEIAEMMTAAVNDALQGVKTPEQAMTDLQAQAQQAIDEFVAQA
jgi:multiple sugar transport system substrate-binding protein